MPFAVFRSYKLKIIEAFALAKIIQKPKTNNQKPITRIPMPRPRFQNLAEEKRIALLEAAAKEFAEYGYEQASLNRILEAGGMSKGAAYYYFDDKADVFATTIRHYLDTIFVELTKHVMQFEPEVFWPNFKQLYIEHLLVNAKEESWRFGVARALFGLAEAQLAHPEIQATFAKINHWVERLIEQGQAIDVIRRDLPKSLLIKLAISVDTTIDEWFAEHGKDLPEEERLATAKRAAELMQSLLQPQ
jgi:AcrR family transcriptional regulator